MHSDPIAELLTKIRNGKKVKKTSVFVQTSKIKTAILKILKEEGFITDYLNHDRGNNITETEIKLKYVKKTSSINGLKQISKPGLRVYANSEKIPYVLNGLGIAIISTNKGVMTDAQARKANVGGEVIAYI